MKSAENTDDPRSSLEKHIAELEQSRAALAESEERHRIISELTTDYMCMVDFSDAAAPRVVWASGNMKKTTGRDVGDITTMDQWTESIHPDDRGAFMEFVRATVATGESGRLECHSISKSGKDRWIRILVRPQRGAGGATRYVYVGVKDISERKQAEELLRRSSEAWAVTFDAISDPIVLLDADQRITLWNRAFSALAGAERDDLTDRKCHEILHGSDHPADGCPFLRMAVSGKRESLEVEARGRSFEVLTDPIHDGRGSLRGAVHIMTDITDRKRLEREKTLVEEELQQARKMEAIGRLAGGIAHDFNNMLTGIMGNAEYLQMKLADAPETALFAEKIVTLTEHAARLTSQLLAFARKGRYREVALDMHALIRETVEILGGTLDKRIRIEQDLRAAPSGVRGDPSQLESALMNLAINARDAMPDGGCLSFSTDTVRLDAAEIQKSALKIPPGRYIRIRVRDTGVGMPPEVQRRIFEPFFTTKSPGEGTGLGLAGVYGTVMNHGGCIQFHSEPGHGSLFTLHLPCVEEMPPEAAQRKPPPDRPARGTLLVVDDEPAVLEMARRILESSGFTVHAFGGGADALEFFRGRHDEIDLVILDMIMPDMDGAQVFAELKKSDPGVRVLISSGYSAEGTPRDMLGRGVRGFVEKPYHMAELTEMVREALKR